MGKREARFKELSSFEKLIEQIDESWIDAALELTGTATVRRRRLPAEQVVWLVLGMALYRDLSIPEVVDKLGLALPGERGVSVAPSAVPQARSRLGPEPLVWLSLALTARLRECRTRGKTGRTSAGIPPLPKRARAAIRSRAWRR